MGETQAAPSRWLELAALTLVYTAVAKLGLMLDAVSGFAGLVWAPTGIALAAVLLRGPHLLAAVFLGAFAVNVWAGAPLLAALGIAVGNTLEAAIGAWSMRRFADFRGAFDRLRHVLGLILPASILSTLVSATIGVTSLGLTGTVTTARMLETWRAWWIGDMLGDLVVASLFLAWATARDLRPTPARGAEAALLGGTLIVASLSVLSGVVPIPASPVAFPYLLFPLFVWAAVRFELVGAATAIAVVSAVAIWGAARGSGPFARETLSASLLGVQTFMGSAAFTTLVVAGAIADRARAISLRENFAASVSHDLKNPLSAIQISAVSLGRAPDASTERVQKHVALVERNMGRMTRLLKDMLDAAAIEAGHLSLERRAEAADTLLREAMEIWQPVAASKNRTLDLRVVAPVSLHCDKERILQVLGNLVGNALKFTKEEGVITVTVDRRGPSAHLTVEDTGTGIEPAALRHVFDRYWRGKTSSGGGTGLGLFIAKGIIDAHGGKLWAESRVGVGSRFHFTLPVHPKGPEEVQGEERRSISRTRSSTE